MITNPGLAWPNVVRPLFVADEQYYDAVLVGILSFLNINTDLYFFASLADIHICALLAALDLLAPRGDHHIELRVARVVGLRHVCILVALSLSLLLLPPAVHLAAPPERVLDVSELHTGNDAVVPALEDPLAALCEQRRIPVTPALLCDHVRYVLEPTVLAACVPCSAQPSQQLRQCPCTR